MNDESKNEVTLVESHALREITSAEVDVQIMTAKRFPRHLEKVSKKALSLATLDKDIARSCFYVLRRGGKNIEGPGVRLSEIIASQWGNLRVRSRIIEVSDTVVRAEGTALDLETNYARNSEVSVRITDKNGRRYSDDMIAVTGNAACAKAARNAIYQVIPFAYIKPIYEAAKKTAIGDVSTLKERKDAALQKFKDLKVTKDQLVAYLEVNSWEDVGLYELETLIGTFTSIEDGTTTVAETFKAKPAGAKTDPTAGGDPGPSEPPPEKPKKKRGPKKGSKNKIKGVDVDKTPNTDVRGPEEAQPENGYQAHKQQYNTLKAQMTSMFGSEGTNEWIGKRLLEMGKDLSQFEEQDWKTLFASINEHLTTG